MDIIPQYTGVPDLGIIMSKDCLFDSHIFSLSRKCKNLAGWILRSFVSRDKLTMLTLFKSLVISRLDYASQLLSPHKISQITQIEKVQRSFTKHIAGMRDLSYHERQQALRQYLRRCTIFSTSFYITFDACIVKPYPSSFQNTFHFCSSTIINEMTAK